MIKKALKQITIISDDENDNLENYLDALNYLDNMYKFIQVIQPLIDVNDIEFLPSFKGKYIVERLGIPSVAEENELKLFKIKSKLFISDKELISKLKKSCTNICDSITQNNDIIIFTLK